MSVYLPARRPLAVTLVILGVILFGLWNVSKAIALAQNMALLSSRGIQPAPGLQLAVAIVWAVLFLGMAGLLVKRRPFTRIGVPALILGFGLYTLGIRLLFSPLPVRQQGDWFITGTFFLGMTVLAAIALERGWKNNYYKERSEDT